MLPPACNKHLRASIKAWPRAFTLVELLISMALLVIILGIVIRMTELTSRIWQSSTARIQMFQEARAGFESMTRKLSQATLNTYYDYYGTYPGMPTTTGTLIARCQVTGTAALANFVPVTYDRYSELHFVSGQAATLLGTVLSGSTQTQAVFFQAPLGYSVNYQQIDNALNACGYFLQFGTATDAVPPHVLLSPSYKTRYRFRLMEMTQPSENLAIYSGTTTATANNWFVQNAASNSRVIAENVIALVLLPKLPDSQDDPNGAGQGVSLAPYYNYNSRVPLDATSDPWWPSFPGDSFFAYPMATETATQGTRHAQMPPLMHLVMIAIDETSAARIQGNLTAVPPGINLNTTTLFTNAANLAQDIQSVQNICNAQAGNLTKNTVRLNYRVFTSDLIMRGAKWSNN